MQKYWLLLVSSILVSKFVHVQILQWGLIGWIPAAVAMLDIPSTLPCSSLSLSAKHFGEEQQTGKASISSFFNRQQTTAVVIEPRIKNPTDPNTDIHADTPTSPVTSEQDKEERITETPPSHYTHTPLAPSADECRGFFVVCECCGKHLDPNQVAEHEDFHYAMALQKVERKLPVVGRLRNLFCYLPPSYMKP